MFDQLSMLDTSKTTWRIKVRVTRMWPSVSSTVETNNGLKGYNMILLDDDDCHVHAFVYAENWKLISNLMVEGGLYIISNFYTREAKGTLKPTSSKILINFSNSTTVEKLEEDDFMIPRHKFELVDLSDLFRIASECDNSDTPEFAIDIIGVLEDFEDVKIIQTMFGERNIARFRITDGRYSHKVSVWGNLATSLDEMHKNIKEKPIIAIVTSTKLKIFKTSVQISTLPSTKIYLNLEDDSVNSMRIRLESEGYKAPEVSINSPIRTAEISVIEEIAVKELAYKTTTDDIDKFFICKVKVSKVEDSSKWWYFSCSGQKCTEEVYKLEGKFKCPKCGKSIPVAERRYKIVVIAGHSGESFSFVLMDRAVKRIIGQTVTKLMAENKLKEEDVTYPPKIKDISGREFTFTIQISSDNVLLNSKIFNVTDAYEYMEDKSAASTPSNASFGGVSGSGFSDRLSDIPTFSMTPESANSVSKKIKMEK